MRLKQKLALFLLVFVLIFFWLNNNSSVWDGKRRFTIIIQKINTINQDFQTVLFSIEPRQKKAIYLTLPVNTLLEVPYGYQDYQLSSVYNLGKLDKKRSGGELLLKSIEMTLGIMVDRYYVFESSELNLPSDKKALQNFKNSYFSLRNFFFSLPALKKIHQQADHHLTFSELFFLWSSIRSLRIDQIIIADILTNYDITKETIRKDNSRIIEIENELFDASFANSFQDSQIRNENLSLEIVNASGREKLAYQFTRILEHLGANVINKSTAKEELLQTCVIKISSDDEKKSLIVNLIKREYRCGIDQNQVEPGSADLVVVLGKEFARW